MSGFATKDVARLLGISEQKVRAFARQGFLTAARGARGEYRYSFHDVVVLRAAKELLDASLPPRKVLRALSALKQRLPRGRALSAVRIAVLGDEVVVRDSRRSWHPESGQFAFDFTTEAMADQAAAIVRRLADSARHDGDMNSTDWYRLGLDLESVSAVAEAEAAYRQAIALQPGKADAHINLGRLLHEQGLIQEAELHYRLAMKAQPEDATAAFNLGIALEDLCRVDEAAQAYRRAIEVDPGFADAHYNLAHLYERSSERAAAIRHLARYKALTKDQENGI
ncbi:MAG: tetratricopeptide repeat protein [Gammaproteobacteria bacterium]